MADKDEGTKTRERVIIHRGPRGRQATGDDDSYRRQLEDENHRYRRALKETRADLAAMEKRLPAEGSVVLTADQAKLWAVITDRKIDTMEKLTAALDAEGRLKEQASAAELDQAIEAASEAWSFPASTLRDMVLANALKLEERDVVSVVDEGGKKVRKTEKVWHLGTGKDGDVPLPVGDYIEQRAPDYAALLGSVEADKGGAARGASTTSTTATAARRVVTQSSGGGTSSKGGSGAHTAVQRTLERNRARAQGPSPLRPVATTEAAARSAHTGKE